MAFISLHLAEKEYFHPESLRKTLSYIYHLITKRQADKSLAIHLANKRCIEKYGVDFGKSQLRSHYNSRLANIKNAKDKYKLWALEIRERNAGIKPKLCECGCGQEVKKNNKFINGHNAKCRDKAEAVIMAARMREIRKQKKEGIVIQFSKSLRNPKNG